MRLLMAILKSRTPAPRNKRFKSSGSSRLVRMASYSANANNVASRSLAELGNSFRMACNPRSRSLGPIFGLPLSCNSTPPVASRTGRGVLSSANTRSNLDSLKPLPATPSICVSSASSALANAFSASATLAPLWVACCKASLLVFAKS